MKTSRCHLLRFRVRLVHLEFFTRIQQAEVADGAFSGLTLLKKHPRWSVFVSSNRKMAQKAGR